MNCFLFGLLLNVERRERKAIPVGRRGTRLFRAARR
jgi:hypothetical protein